MDNTSRPLRLTDLLVSFLVLFTFALTNMLCFWATQNVILTSLLSGPVCVVLLARPAGPIRLRGAFRPQSLPASSVLSGMGAGILSIAASALLGELTQLPNPAARAFIPLLGNPLTWIAIGLAGPVCEELLFREGIQGGLTRKGARPAWAIAVGSLLFSLAHGNPAQSLAAICSGIVLGILYHRSQNILLCGLIHIVNNVLALLQLRLSSGNIAGTPLLDALGSRPLAWAVLAVLYLGIGLMLWKMFPDKKEKSYG